MASLFCVYDYLYMIKKKYKLNTEDFKYKYTSLYNGEYLNIRVHYYNSNFNKYTVTVSKKVAKRSVDRNSLKRKIYSILEKYIIEINTEPALYIEMLNNSKQALYMIIVKKPFENKDIESIDRDIKTLFNKTL